MLRWITQTIQQPIDYGLVVAGESAKAIVHEGSLSLSLPLSRCVNVSLDDG